MNNSCLQIEIFYWETRAAKVCLPFVGHLMRNRKDMNQISFLNSGYAFKGLLAVCMRTQENSPNMSENVVIGISSLCRPNNVRKC